MIQVAVLTVSDRSARGEREDLGGPAVAEEARDLFGAEEVVREIVPDDRAEVAAAIVRLAGKARLVLTTGGTGIGDRDVTVEATRDVIEREIPGFGEEMRRRSREHLPTAILSRATAGTLGTTLVVNLPGSPRGAVECLGYVAAAIEHALELMASPGVDVHATSGEGPGR